MEVLTNPMLQYTFITNHHIVHLKLKQCYMLIISAEFCNKRKDNEDTEEELTIGAILLVEKIQQPVL